MSVKYILDGHKPVACNDLIAWAKWFQTDARTVAVDQLCDVRVSTVFLGLDFRFGAGAPLLFETMVFGGPHDGDEDRYATWAEAQAGHARMVAKVKGEK